MEIEKDLNGFFAFFFVLLLIFLLFETCFIKKIFGDNCNIKIKKKKLTNNNFEITNKHKNLHSNNLI